MTDTTDIARVAAGLTKAQRDWVLGARSLRAGAGMWPLRNALARKGLVSGFAATKTPLADTLRAYLENGNAGLDREAAERGREGV